MWGAACGLAKRCTTQGKVLNVALGIRRGSSRARAAATCGDCWKVSLEICSAGSSGKVSLGELGVESLRSKSCAQSWILEGEATRKKDWEAAKNGSYPRLQKELEELWQVLFPGVIPKE